MCTTKYHDFHQFDTWLELPRSINSRLLLNGHGWLTLALARPSQLARSEINGTEIEYEQEALISRMCVVVTSLAVYGSYRLRGGLWAEVITGLMEEGVIRYILDGAMNEVCAWNLHTFGPFNGVYNWPMA